jgi:carboxylesterase
MHTNDIPSLIPGARPQFYRGDAIGCLIIHGFMASPGEVGWLGSHLADLGHTVYVPRLTGHGIDPVYMSRMRWEDWYAHVIDGYYLLQQQCDQVYVIGHSMGGLLAMLLTLKQPVDGLVMAASPVHVPHPLMRFTRWLSWIRPYTHHPGTEKLNAIIRAEQERRGEPAYSRVHYPRWSSRAVYELYRLIRTASDHLNQVTAPLLLLYAERDATASLDNMHHIAQQVQSDLVQTYILTQGEHIIFQDDGREEAFAAVADFIQARITAQPTISHH